MIIVGNAAPSVLRILHALADSVHAKLVGRTGPNKHLQARVVLNVPAGIIRGHLCEGRLASAIRIDMQWHAVRQCLQSVNACNAACQYVVLVELACTLPSTALPLQATVTAMVLGQMAVR